MMNKKKYTIGLDIGTTSVGWAVIDDDFNLVQGKKKIVEIDVDGNKKKRMSRTNLWGVRLFDEGKVAADTRLKRGGRRRLTRRKKRLNYLREIFHDEITKFDESFFIRMDESFYQNADDIKSIKTQYPFFNGITGSGETYSNEKDYYENYPTFYHLRQRLIENPEQADLRLIYLAMHHILKFRGHFVNQGQNFDLKNIDVAESLLELLHQYEIARQDSFEFKFDDAKHDEANAILVDRKKSKSWKAFNLTQLFSVLDMDEYFSKYDQGTDKKTEKFLQSVDGQLKALFTAIVGNSIDVAKIFGKDEYKPSDENKFTKGGDFKYANENFEEKLAEIESEVTPEEFDVLITGKKVYEAITLSNILIAETLAASMVLKYDLHKQQLAELKEFTKSISYECFEQFFKENGIYSKFIQGVGNPAKTTAREDFYKEIKKAFESEFSGLKFPDAEKEFDFSKADLRDEQEVFLNSINESMRFETYLPKQRMSDNGAIPYQVHEHELIEIIKNQGTHYPFLAQKVTVDADEKQEDEYKIQTLMKFRIPYYVGPLIEATIGTDGNKKSDKSRFAWMQKKDGNSGEKITPWNFNQIVDKEASAVEFIERMTSFCTYLPDKKVLPKNSLLYQEFTIYNELIIGGWYHGSTKCYFPAELRQKIVDKLFKKSKKVTAKAMIDFLNAEENLNLESPKQLFGIDTFVKAPSYNTTYSTFIDLRNAGIPEQMIEDNRKKFEQIIKWQTIFEDNKVLKKRITIANDEWGGLLTTDQIKKLAKKHYTGWGRLSKELLNGAKATNGKTIIENLKEEKFNNFMRLIEDEKIAQTIKDAQVGNADTDELHYDMVRDLAGSPAIKKGIWQSLKIIKELESYLGKENISKIVVEMAREHSTGRTQTRQKQIENFYNKFKEKTEKELDRSLHDEFKSITEAKNFDNEKLFLYFLQNGKCMYSGSGLDLSRLSEYEVDHIIPQTYIKDDSFDNKVLVLKKENQNKGGDVPQESIVLRMSSFWELLAKSGQVSPRKLKNLKMKRISEGDKEGFINRQLVETRQITKHVANILANYFKENKTEILTPKSSLTSQFREGVVYIPKEVFSAEETMNANMTYEVAGEKILPTGEVKDSKYSNSNFRKVHFHNGFKKNRDINDYHHAHDAYLNAIVATYVYHTRPELRDMWVYGEYQKKVAKITGKYAEQRKNFAKQILTGMANEQWDGYDAETGEITHEWSRDEILTKISKNLRLRGINIVKKTETQIGKFGDESVKKKGATMISVKAKLDPARYGGATSPISAFTVLVENNKGEVKPLSVPSAMAKNYEKTDNKVTFLTELYQKEKINKIIITKIPKYQYYILPNGAHRLVASYQEGQPASQLPMMKIAGEGSTAEEQQETYNILSDSIKKNKLFIEKKLPLLDTIIKENFEIATNEEKAEMLAEMMRVTKGSNQGLKALKQAGLEAIKQQLTGSGNIINSNTTLVYKSPTGLFETRKKL